MSQSGKEGEGEKISRRRMLRNIGFAVLGAAVVLGAGGLVERAQAGGKQGAPAATQNSTGPGGVAQGSMITVTADYLLMPSFPATQDSFVIQSPAHYSDVLPQILARRPQLEPMMPTMMVFIDGYPAKPATVLHNGDEIDFIPVMVGG